MPTRKELIQAKAIEILKVSALGVPYAKLANEIKRHLPDVPIKTIYGVIWNLEVRRPNEVYKAGRGLFRHMSFKETQVAKEEGIT